MDGGTYHRHAKPFLRKNKLYILAHLNDVRDSKNSRTSALAERRGVSGLTRSVCMPATGFSFSGSTLEESDLRESRRPDIGSAASRRDAHASAAESSGCRFLLAHRTDIGAAGAIIIVFAIFGALNPNFLTARNLSGIITVSAEIGLLSLGVGLVIIEIDIPIAAVFTVAGIIMGQLLTWGWSDIVALGVVLLFGLVGGAQFDRTEQDRGIRYCLQRIATKRQAQSEALTADLSWPIRDQHAWLADLALRTGQMSPQGVIISGAE